MAPGPLELVIATSSMTHVSLTTPLVKWMKVFNCMYVCVHAMNPAP